VIDTPATLPSAVRYRLATFGTPTLVGPGDSTVLGSHGHHRRRLALLAVLAAAGDRGRSRDQLLGLFWPEATQGRARHALEQLLYLLRSSIGESVFATSNPVSLNADLVRSDVAEFGAALQRGDLEAAVEQYRGPFLDGFYLEDTPGFERWVEAERAHLADSYCDALARLAAGADAAKDHATAVRWWRRLAEADPLSSRNATGLIRALASAGDHAAALQYAERYEVLVSEELGVSVGPMVADLVAEVRKAAKTDPVATSRSPPASSPSTRSQSAPVIAPQTTAMPNDLPSVGHVAAVRRLTQGVVVGLAAVTLVGAALWATRHFARPAAAAERSIAVLPLANVTRNPGDAAIVDGLTEELIGDLAKLGGVRVIARTSAFMFKNSSADVRRIADSLGVSYVLEGGVQRADSGIRVEVRLVDARDGSTRWSDTYDRKLRDIFAVQSDIAGEVARELDVRLGRAALAHIRRGPTTNIAAYELYLRGNDPAATRSDSLARRSLEYFRQAIALDSTYAAAYAGLARMHARLAVGDDTLSRRERLALAERAALKAVALDDSLGDAHGALGVVRRETLDLASAETEFERAVALEPRSARFHQWLAQVYALTEGSAKALAEAHRAVSLDPLSPNAIADLARVLLANGRCDEALAEIDKLRAVRPPLLRARAIAGICYARKGMWPEAMAQAQQNMADGGPRAEALLGYMLARVGRPDDARRIVTPLEEHWRRVGGGAFEVATVYAGLGDKDQAFAWLDKAVKDRAVTFEYLPAVLDALASDPRVDDFRRRLGMRER
jgi:TolB-like protein/DNA-binding SARP family transcriptional activator/Flp pilus assembly protein TadD